MILYHTDIQYIEYPIPYFTQVVHQVDPGQPGVRPGYFTRMTLVKNKIEFIEQGKCI